MQQVQHAYTKPPLQDPVRPCPHVLAQRGQLGFLVSLGQLCLCCLQDDC